jgi:hypothetical protein
MDLEHGDREAPDLGVMSFQDEVPLARQRLILSIIKLMGNTTGLAQRTGTKTADGIVAAGRRAGKLLEVPSKLSSLSATRKVKKLTDGLQAGIEPLQSGLRDEYTRKLSALQADKASLLSVLQEAQSQAEAGRARVAALEAELAAVCHEKAHLQAANESLKKELEGSQKALRAIRAAAVRTTGRVRELSA